MSMVSEHKRVPMERPEVDGSATRDGKDLRRTSSWVKFNGVVTTLLQRLEEGELLVVAPSTGGEWWLSFTRHDGDLLAECVGWSNAAHMRALGWQTPAGSHAHDVMWINASGVWETKGQERQPLTPSTAARTAFLTLRDAFGLRSPRDLIIFGA